FSLELEMLRHALGLSAAVVLWHDREHGTLAVRGYTGDGQLADGPYPDGAGIPGSALRDGGEVAVAPLHEGAGGLPYRGASPRGVGAVLAVAIPAEAGGRPVGVLCVDRARAERWADSEREVVRTAARKLALDVSAWQRLKHTDTEATTISRICVGLSTLNGALGMEQAAAAALAAVRVLVHPQLAVLSIVRGGAHVVLRAEGDGAERLAGLHFSSEEGLVGKAIAHGRPLPVNGTWKGTQGVFTATDRLEGMRSLTIIPSRRARAAPWAP
ncbi:MAG: GAF domain-containing protein, partial [bacterium]